MESVKMLYTFLEAELKELQGGHCTNICDYYFLIFWTDAGHG